MNLSRREILKSALVAGAATMAPSYRVSSQSQPSASGAGVLFDGFPIPPRITPPTTFGHGIQVQEAVLTQLKDGRYWLIFGEGKKMAGRYSSDHGRTWGDTSLVLRVDGFSIAQNRDEPHLSLLHLKSGGLAWFTAVLHPGRDAMEHSCFASHGTRGAPGLRSSRSILFSLCAAPKALAC